MQPFKIIPGWDCNCSNVVPTLVFFEYLDKENNDDDDDLDMENNRCIEFGEKKNERTIVFVYMTLELRLA